MLPLKITTSSQIAWSATLFNACHAIRSSRSGITSGTGSASQMRSQNGLATESSSVHFAPYARTERCSVCAGYIEAASIAAAATPPKPLWLVRDERGTTVAEASCCRRWQGSLGCAACLAKDGRLSRRAAVWQLRQTTRPVD